MAMHAMELIHMEYMAMESGKPGDKIKKDINVLVVSDHFRRYIQAFVMVSQTAKIVAQKLWDKYFIHFGSPEKIPSDQGKEL